MAALLVAMVGCNKEPQQGGSLNPEDKVYMEFKIQTLTTRSSTDNDNGYGSSDANPDVEVGKDYENVISTVDVVLRNANSYVAATVTAPTGSDDKLTWVAEFNSAQLAVNTEYQVYIYANCGARQDVDAVSTETVANMTKENKFWMTNAYEPATVSFTTYSTDKKNPTNLGEHYVERSMARFDYMPNGPYTVGAAQVELTEAALINQSKAFYLLRRVSQDGTATNWTVGGGETKANYVVDTDYAAKNDGYQSADAANFDYHLTAAAGWDWQGITAKDLTVEDNWAGVADGNTGAAGADHKLNQYYIWQYAKENTIAGDVANQQNGLSTGVVFKGKLTGDIVTAAAGEPIYVFNNTLYGTWDKVLAAAANDETLKFYTDKFGETIETTEHKALGAAGFTAYNAADDGSYYTYYYYWNRHNDNGDNTNMGKMEFAVVRNNVYKLCVDSIKKFGHPDPTDPDPVDPDPVDPTDPDEEGEYYFQVTVKVLPWVVRVNHIEF